jgi:phenylalanyl-tRNA synthetase beta chain
MMLSERELELSNEHDGIIVCRDGYEVGSLLRDHLDLATTCSTSRSPRTAATASRSTAWRARSPPPSTSTSADAGHRARPGGSGRVHDLVSGRDRGADRCYRFVARGFQDVAIGPSPLRCALGSRRRDAPISNVVDITNYVMVGLGNPLHAYDATRIAGRRLTARMAQDGETLTTLDGRERRLDADVLVIADADGPSGVAGIMGGAHSEISARTSTVVIEAANFERAGIMRTARALGLRTEGSNRWEKGVDPHLAEQAARWAAELMVAHAGATALHGTLDEIADLPQRERLVLRDGRVREVTAVDVPVAAARHALERLGYEPQRIDGGLAPRVPTWRWLDTTREIDLVEEVARLHAWSTSGHAAGTLHDRRRRLDRGRRLRRRAVDALAGAGLQEVQTVTLVERDEPERYGLDADDPRRATVPLLNPLTPSTPSCAPPSCRACFASSGQNRAVGRSDVTVFELSHSYHPRPDEPLPHEPWRLTAVLAGRLGGAGWQGAGPEADVFVAKGVLEVLLGRLGVTARYEPVRRGHLHPGRAAVCSSTERTSASSASSTRARRSASTCGGRVALFELDLDAVLARVPPLHLAATVPDLPPVRQDIAVVVPADVPAARVLEVAREAGGALLRDAVVFDVYRDAERLGPDRVSLAVRLTFRADDRTLTEDEATAARTVVVEALRRTLGADLRGS